ncbi:hypothetical protein [Sulfitobacter sp.]|uniref:hypothetical protein n=1 Tax=Sulfitobacter sp. TaxID=1903071 RepID=UPI00300349F1
MVHTWLGDLIEGEARCNSQLELELTVEPKLNIAAAFERGGLNILLKTDDRHNETCVCTALPPLAVGWIGAKGIHYETL